MEAALDRIRKEAAGGEDARRKVIVALQSLVGSLETPDDTLHRYGHMVGPPLLYVYGQRRRTDREEQNLQTATIQVGVNLGLFKHLAEASEPLAVDRIAEKTKAEPQLICVVDESGRGEYTANQVTRNLTEKSVEAGISHFFGLTAPQYQCLPDLLKQTGYKTPVDDAKTAFHLAFRTTLDPFSWFAQNSAYLADFHTYHALRRQPDVTWLSVYPVETEAAGWPVGEPLYVNVGGGVGHQCAQFKEKYPRLDGRVILQDLPHTVAEAPPTPGVENMAYNMFRPQPVIGAKFYHLRAVFHNQAPYKVRMLLEILKAAMTPESVLLVDEMVLPEEKVNYMAASIDMTMLAAFASMERTEAQWKAVFEDVGLRMVRTYTYSPLSYESVMDVRLQ
ncbi:S-adenosyl-L-methionine-dependent methyltransferase [Daldinia caldariorum]|uniref:S-adenosyl-L-methionine-dependent methyltransferase n=1 Tax=Daldinia caldariorum TaxID=326644 RepID=UPI002007B712|nr:S-adenosyl-L-methionine-dependent methyltransferase [Daldinia caldariorum]KAI1463631.1 S-adenosyl-L-methionine-dependent methyltransferase [Daldinia caldariorum]